MNNNFNIDDFLMLCGLIFCFCVVCGIFFGITVWIDNKKKKEKEALERTIENKVWHEVKQKGFDQKELSREIERLKYKVEQNSWDIAIMKQPPQIIEMCKGCKK